MANNIFGGQPNAVVCKTAVSFASAGIDSTNTTIIYKVGSPLLSYVPGRSINGITGFELNAGYYFVAKTDMDLTAYCVPPTSSLTQLGTPGSFTAVHSGSSGMALNWSAVTSATGYVLQRALDSGFTSGLTTLVSGSNVLTFSDSGLSALTQYFYRVKAQASGFSDSNYATASDTTAAGSSFVVNDDFTGSASTNLTAHTPTTGGAITKIYSKTGNIVLDGSGFAKYAATDNVGTDYKYANVFSGANQKVTFAFKKIGLLGSSHVEAILICVRGDSSSSDRTSYSVQLLDDGTNFSWAIYKNVNGTGTPLVGQTNRNDLMDGTVKTISFEITGSTLTFKIAGTTAGTWTDSTLTAGREVVIGGICQDSTSANVLKIDSLLAENI